MKKGKRYIVSYVSGSTGYGWDKEYNEKQDFVDFCKAMAHEYTAHISVWDSKTHEFIFLKYALKYGADLNCL